MSDPTRLSSCRSDGRCPECNMPGGSRAEVCGCCQPCGPRCGARHLRALLTEVLRQREALLRECDKELAETAGAVADLLCDPAWVVLHNHGWAVLKERRPKVDALIAKIREALA